MSSKFRVNQKVVYPSQGVGKIVEIFDKEFKGETVSYYKIYIDVSEMIVMVPVATAPDLGIRPIVGADEAKAAMELLSEEGDPITSDWKLRYQMNLDLLKKGTVRDIATIVRTLYNRSKVKELPILERKLYDSAKKLFIMIGSFYKTGELLIILAAAFVIAGGLSFVKILAERNGRERMQYLLSYISEIMQTKQWRLYGEDLKQDYQRYCRNKIHFTVPVLFSVALKVGGII